MVEVVNIQKGNMKDKIDRYYFDKKNYNINKDLAIELLKESNRGIVSKEKVTWLEMYYEFVEETEDYIVFDVVEPYCD